jgi:hypothetical protein
MKRFYLILALVFAMPFLNIAQQKVAWQDGKRHLIQFSGIIVEGDSLRPIPYTSIIVKNSNRGTVSDYFGYFSFVAQESDTIEFSAIGFNSAVFVIPDTLSTSKYSLIQVLRMDTINLALVGVHPWPSAAEFKNAFLKLNLPEDDMTRADRNMARADEKEAMTGMAMDASLNYKYSMQQYQSKLYYAGQLPPNNLLNPIAWAKFIKAWKNGDFKKKK